ncbi:MAG: alpha/beta fold hydrolase [Candidatus Omnitrophica bacterium]|nr:alpha/beta fold hydrolase [Candidatus Omnitrophota bacterium]
MQDLIKDKNSDVLYRKWQAPKTKTVLVLIHGLGAQSARWDALAEFFLESGISSYAIELKGFGETDCEKGHIDSFDVYFKDIESLTRKARAEHPGKKVFILGESMGALIAFHAGLSRQDLFDGTILISPAFFSRLKFSLMEYFRIFAANFYNPCRRFKMPFDSGMCTRDEEYQTLLDNDPAEHRFATAKLLWCTFTFQVKSLFRAKKIKKPVLFLLAGKDSLASPEVSKCIFKKVKTKDKKIIVYPEMCHALSIERGKEKVFGDILDWINNGCGR